jgi:hypothetical protein
MNEEMMDSRLVTATLQMHDFRRLGRRTIDKYEEDVYG